MSALALFVLISILVVAGEGVAIATCEAAGACADVPSPTAHDPSSRLLAHLQYVEVMGRPPKFVGSPLTLDEYSTFGAIGAIVCQAQGKRHTSTAFLVGSFDLVVTVARNNVVIGIHTRLRSSTRTNNDCVLDSNAMIVMSEWLEHTLR